MGRLAKFLGSWDFSRARQWSRSWYGNYIVRPASLLTLPILFQVMMDNKVICDPGNTSGKTTLLIRLQMALEANLESQSATKSGMLHLAASQWSSYGIEHCGQERLSLCNRCSLCGKDTETVNTSFYTAISLINCARFSLISEAFPGLCLVRLMRLFSVGRRLELGLQTEKDGGWYLLVYGGLYGEREMIDVLK